MSECARHDWRESIREGDPHPWRCADCDETSATCDVCAGPAGSALLICRRCEKRERHVLDDIDRLFSQGGGEGVPDWGGGSTAVRDRQPRTWGILDADDERPAPATSRDRLLSWVARWSEHVGASNLGDTDYLRGHLLWAVHNPALSDWERYRGDIRSIRALAQAEAGLWPEALGDRCMHCDGKLVRDWADKHRLAYHDGRQDEVRCMRCGTTWPSVDEARLHVRQRVRRLPHQEPDTLVTLMQARKIWPEVPMSTMHSWVRRDIRDHEASIAETDAWDDHWTDWQDSGQIGPIPAPPEFYDLQLPECGERGGRPLYRLGDLFGYAARRMSDGRRGRKAG